MINGRFRPVLIALTAIPFAYGYAQCWYPDQVTEAPDVPCNSGSSASACCGADAWCLDNGLCYGNGVVSRGSCTDQSWKSPECAVVCATENTDSGIPISPCNPLESTFVCGSGGSGCIDNTGIFTMSSGVAGNNIVLRASQVSGESTPMTIAPTSTITVSSDDSNESNSSGSTITVTASPSSSGTNNNNNAAMFTAGDMAGVGAGVGAPLLLALLGALFVIFRQKKRTDKSADPQHEYKGAYAPAPAFQSSHPPSQQPGVYAHYASQGQQQLPPQGGADSMQYQPMASGRQQRGHFAEMTPVSEMDGSRNRSELPTSVK